MSRIVHVHHQHPGVLAQVNSILAEHEVNIEGQLLSTRGEYGYLITDIGGGLHRRGARPAARDGPDRPAAGAVVSDLSRTLRRRSSATPHVLVDAGPEGAVRDRLDPPLHRRGAAAWCARRTPREVAAVVGPAPTAGVPITVQGGNTGLVGGGVPAGGEVLLSLGRLAAIEDRSTCSRRRSPRAPASRWRSCSSTPAPPAWTSASTWPPGRRPPSAAWSRPTPAACGWCATAACASS